MSIAKALLFIIIIILLWKPTQAQDALCYSEHVNTNEKGTLGIIDNTVLSYEAWNVKSAGGSSYSAIVLRTDTTRLADSIDFCLDVEHESDTVFVLISRGDETYDYATTKASDIPSLFQILKVTNGFQQFHKFNQANSNQKIYLQDDKLYLTYTVMGKNEPTQVTEVFVLEKGKFVSTQPRSEK